jgi:malonate decarboxylase beta subunit
MKRTSFSEMMAREKARSVLNESSGRELLGPFARLESPHLSVQDIVPQSDDGVVIVRGRVSQTDAVVISMEGAFQGGSIGEVNGAKIAGSLELALRDARAGTPTIPVLLFDTGGIRLQEANLGLLTISEIHSAIVALRHFVPVIGVIAGRVGCFGGMSITAALCTFLIGTEVGRLGLNGPEVIEQEAGAGEFDSRDRELIWQTLGCRRRLELGQVDQLVDDSVDDVAAAIRNYVEVGHPTQQLASVARTRNIEVQITKIARHAVPASPQASLNTESSSRGLRWFHGLMGKPTADYEEGSVLVEDTQWGSESIRAICVVRNSCGKFSRARQGQVGIEEGWAIARAVWDAIRSDEAKIRRSIVAVVDTPGQAFGWHEESLGIHLALAAAVDAYATARELGHPVIALVVGKAISGAFLAHGLQANEILALDDDGVEVHVMSEASAARVTRRSPKEVAALAKIVPSTARDVKSFAGLGGIDRLIKVDDAEEPDSEGIKTVRDEILGAVGRVRNRSSYPHRRLLPLSVRGSRTMAWRVREELESQWTTKH